jgi:hypothetical protein
MIYCKNRNCGRASLVNREGDEKMSPLFIIAILVFIVLGFRRGWRRELISLVFILLATFLVNVNTSSFVGDFLGRIPVAFAVLAGTTPSPSPPSSQALLPAGALPSFFIFAGLVVLGYIVGNRVFPKPATPTERLIGIIPGILSGAFVLWYLEGFLQNAMGRPSISLDFAGADPGQYVAVIFVVAILSLVAALIAARVKKAQAAPPKK